MKLDLLAPPEELADGCWRISLHDPFVPYVTSVFLITTGPRPWLIDAGADSEESANGLRAKLDAIDIRLADVAGCILSHSHLDHAGGLLRWRPDRLLAHERTADEMANRSPRSSRGPEALRRMGVSEAVIDDLAPHGEPVQIRLADVEVDTRLNGMEGALEGCPGWRWHLAEGHAPGHLMFHHAASGSLLGGDQFLEKWKTPYLISDPERDSFGDYLASVNAALDLEPEAIYPSHTWAIRPASRWLRERRETLLHQLDRAREAVAAGARTAHEAVLAQYPDTSKPGIRVILMREQLAILRHLAASGAVSRDEVEGVERFTV